jgi:hypothetical protein
MIQLDTRLPLMAQGPNVLAAMDAGTVAAGNTANLLRQAEGQNLFRQYGAGAMQGDQNALAQIAGFDPMMGQNMQAGQLDMQATRQGMALDREKMQMLRDQTARALAEAEDQAQAAAEAKQMDQFGTALIGAHAAGNQSDWAKLSKAAFGRVLPFNQTGLAYVAAMHEGAKTYMGALPKGPEFGVSNGFFYDKNNPQAGAQPIPGMPPTQPLVQNIIGANSNKFVDKSDEAAAARLGTIVETGLSAQQFMGDLQALAGLAANINTGKGAEVMAALGPYAEALGVNVEGLSDLQAFNAIRDRLAPQMRPPGSGAASDFDARQFLSSLPSLARTPEGNKVINDTLQALYQHRMAAAEFARKAQRGELSWQDAEDQIAALGNPFETFNASRDRIQGGGSTSAPAPDFLSPVDRQIWPDLDEDERQIILDSYGNRQ